MAYTGILILVGGSRLASATDGLVGDFIHTEPGGDHVVSMPDIVTDIIMVTVTDTGVVLLPDIMQEDGRHITMCIVIAKQEYKQGHQDLQET